MLYLTLLNKRVLLLRVFKLLLKILESAITNKSPSKREHEHQQEQSRSIQTSNKKL